MEPDPNSAETLGLLAAESAEALTSRRSRKSSHKSSVNYLFDGNEGWRKESASTQSPGYGAISLAKKKSLQDISPVGISWHNICVELKKNGKKILNNVSGLAEPGQFVALMGSR